MKLKVSFSRLLAFVILIVLAVPFPTVEAAAVFPSQTIDELAPTTTLADGEEIVALEINSPPKPPDEYLIDRSASMVTSLDRAAIFLPNFPSYDWVFGCSAVSAAMIAGYYDNNGYPDVYTGPTNGGVMPITDTGWGTWSDGASTFPNNPLVASHDGVDGMAGRGSIDDYWVGYGSTADDPYITGPWTQHTWGTAIGDYMKTSQSVFGNTDGSTNFYSYTSNARLTCSDMESLGIAQEDGTYGVKLFYEEKGYAVDDANCFSQQTDAQIVGGYSLTSFKNEIDNGRPVMINLHGVTQYNEVVGHTVVGFGYDGDRIYFRNTWDSNPSNNYWMNWSGNYIVGTTTYSIASVSIVHLEDAPEPGAFGKSSPSNGAGNQWTSLTLSWGSSSGASGYEYCIYESGGSCSAWVPNSTSTSVPLSGLSEGTAYEWQVRANNAQGTTYANGSELAYWSFTTIDLSTLTEKVFLPLLVRD